MAEPKTYVCALTGKSLRSDAVVHFSTLRPSLSARILRDHPSLAPESWISAKEVARYRKLYIEDLLREESGELSQMDKQVADSLAAHETIADNVEESFEDVRTFSDRVSDHMASFGGSWTFLIAFASFLAVWMLINVERGPTNAFDPYPFILLNLILSTIAAVQAPIIMMSQRRQESKDRLRSLNDYRVNLKAELEIRHLHEKVDHLINNQWRRLAEIQQLQIELLEDRHKS